MRTDELAALLRELVKIARHWLHPRYRDDVVQTVMLQALAQGLDSIVTLDYWAKYVTTITARSWPKSAGYRRRDMQLEAWAPPVIQPAPDTRVLALDRALPHLSAINRLAYDSWLDRDFICLTRQQSNSVMRAKEGLRRIMASPERHGLRREALRSLLHDSGR